MPLPGYDIKSGLFIGPHALERFRERVCSDITDEEIRREIFWRTRRLPNDVDIYNCEKNALVYRSIYEGFVYCIWVGPGNEKKGDWPAVRTITVGDEQINRWYTWRNRKWRNSREGRKLKVLQMYGFTVKECALIIGKPVDEVRERWRDNNATIKNSCSDGDRPSSDNRHVFTVGLDTFLRMDEKKSS